MARLFKARLKAGGDAGAVQRRTGILLWPGEWKPMNEYLIGSARTEALAADPDVEIDWQDRGEEAKAVPPKAEPEPAKPKEARGAKE